MACLLLLAAFPPWQSSCSRLVDASDLANAESLENDVAYQSLNASREPDGSVWQLLTSAWTTVQEKTIKDSSASAGEVIGVTKNEDLGYDELRAALVTSSGTALVVFVLFSFLRMKYKAIYANNTLSGCAPKTERLTPLSWITDSISLDLDEVEKIQGLDARMLLEFCNLSISILVIISVPLVFVMLPLHYSSRESASQTSFSIENLSKDSLLIWVHAIVVLFVLHVINHRIGLAKIAFLERRLNWLRAAPAPRAFSILVEGIPSECRSDEAIASYFNKLFEGEVVERAYVVRRTQRLVKLLGTWVEAERKLLQAEFEWEKHGKQVELRPTFWTWGCRSVDCIQHYRAKLAETEVLVRNEQTRIKLGANQTGNDVLAASGFVTFKERRHALLARSLCVTADSREFKISTPPDPDDVMYEDLQGSRLAWLRFGIPFSIIGYLLVLMIFVLYVPLVREVQLVTKLETVRKVPIFGAFLSRHAWLEPLLEGVMSGIVLNVVMSFVPSIFQIIAHNLIKIKAHSWHQHVLQKIYFGFLLTFVMLPTLLDHHILFKFWDLLNKPTELASLLAKRIPPASHFYMNYMMIQIGSVSLQLLRLSNFAKFLFYRPLYKDQNYVLKLSEPEDQDYYGLGSRSARVTLHLIMGLVLCNSAPLIIPITLTYIILCRLVWGYLLVFAETRKPDLGGVCWHTSLSHLHLGIYIYIALMAGIFNEHYVGPAKLLLIGFAYQLHCTMWLHTRHKWKDLPFEELILENDSRICAAEKPSGDRDTYFQVELFKVDEYCSRHEGLAVVEQCVADDVSEVLQ